MSGETEQTQTETEAAEATETGQETAPSESAEAADEFETEWAQMVAAETGDPEAGAGDDDPESTETETGTAEEPSGDAADETGSQATSETADEDPDSTQAATETGEDPDGDAATVDWEKLPAAAKSAFEAEKARADRAEHSFKSRKGREAALQRRLDEYLAASGETSEPAADRSQDDTGSEPAVSEEARTALAEFETEFPDIAQPLMKHVIGPLTAQLQQAQQRINGIERGLQTVGEDRLDATLAEQEAAVMAEHEDYDDIADSDEFVEWAESQPDFIKAGIQANAKDIVDSATVSKILHLYKADKGIANGHSPGNGADAGDDNPGTTEDAGGSPPSETKPAADPVRRIQLASSRGNPEPSPGPSAREDTGNRSETEESVWAELRREEERKLAAQARA